MEGRLLQPFFQVRRFPEEPEHDAVVTLKNSQFAQHPEFATCADAVLRYAVANSRERRQYVDRTVERCIQQPQVYADTINALLFMEQMSGYPAALALRTDLERGFERCKSIGAMPVDVLQGWLEMFVEKKDRAQTAERVLRQAIVESKNSAEITSILYKIVLAGLRGCKNDVLKTVLELWAFRTPLLRIEDPQAMVSLVALHDRNDLVLQQAIEIDTALFYFSSHLYPDVCAARMDAAKALFQTEAMQKLQQAQFQVNPERYRRITDLHNTQFGKGVLDVADIDISQFPYTLLVRNIGQLRRFFNRTLATTLEGAHPQEVVAYVDAPEVALVVTRDTVVDVSRFVQDALKVESTGVVMSESTQISTLAHLVPESMNFTERWEKITTANTEMRKEMREDSRCLLSPRGDEIEVVDPMVKGLGFHAITYRMCPQNRRATQVDIQVGAGHTYRCILDESFVLRAVRDDDALQLPRHGMFFEYVVLSHVHAIRCSQQLEDSSVQRARDGEAAGKTRFSRRAHRRILPIGHKPTPEQVALMREVYDVDIEVMNADRAQRGEKNLVTYVSDAFVEQPHAQPVHSTAPYATQRLNGILKS